VQCCAAIIDKNYDRLTKIISSKIAERARKIKPAIKLVICGEHGGHPASVKFFNSLGFDCVSCSLYRIPIARLAAAQGSCNEQDEGAGLASYLEGVFFFIFLP